MKFLVGRGVLHRMETKFGKQRKTVKKGKTSTNNSCASLLFSCLVCGSKMASSVFSYMLKNDHDR